MSGIDLAWINRRKMVRSIHYAQPLQMRKRRVLYRTSKFGGQCLLSKNNGDLVDLELAVGNGAQYLGLHA